jgi:hypothetical protein
MSWRTGTKRTPGQKEQPNKDSIPMKTELAQDESASPDIYARVEHITPELAAEILARTSTRNRKLSRNSLERYSSHLRGGQWRLNGETIKLTPNGQLIDGQHRLTAIMQTGIAADVLVAYNVSAEAQSSIDRGKARSIADTLTINHFSQAQLRGAICRLAMAYGRYAAALEEAGEDGPRMSFDILLRVITPEEVLQFARQHSEELEFAIIHGWRIYSAVGSLAPVGGTIYLLYQLDTPRAERFCEMMESGRFVDQRDDAILVLRERLLREKSARRRLESKDILAICIKAVNLWIHGLEASPQAISLRRGEPYPVLSLDEQPLSKNARKLRRRRARNGNGVDVKEGEVI